MMQILVGIMVALVLWPATMTLAQEKDTCPIRLANLQGAVVGKKISVRLAKVYTALNCGTIFATLPGQRGLQLFNQHQVDGEVFRLALIEDRYRRDFVRSAEPVGEVRNALWYRAGKRPDPNWQYVGYIRGIVWQEVATKGKDSRVLTDHAALLRAYNEGKIDGFLLAMSTVEDFYATGQLDDLPEMVGEPLMIRPIYHYLGAEYAPFMRRFNEEYTKWQSPLGLRQ